MLYACDGPLLLDNTTITRGGGGERGLHARGVDAQIRHAVEGEPDGGAVAVDDAGLLEDVADDGKLGGPGGGGIGAPEEEEGVEDVVVGVEGLGIVVDAGCEVVVVCGEDAKVGVCGGEVGVALGFCEGRLFARWASGLGVSLPYSMIS